MNEKQQNKEINKIEELSIEIERVLNQKHIGYAIAALSIGLCRALRQQDKFTLDEIIDFLRLMPTDDSDIFLREQERK